MALTALYALFALGMETAALLEARRYARELEAQLPAGVREPSLGLRLGVTGSWRFGLFPGRERDSDEIVEHEGRILPLIGKELARFLVEATIDRAEMSQGPELVLHRPRPKKRAASSEA